ncbi:hypothetical protein ACHAPX_008273 [Trichoderma viride]
MPQNPRLPLQVHILDPLVIILVTILITMLRIIDCVFQALTFLDHWVLALIVHHEIAWLICTMWLAIGEGTTASWRLQMKDMGDDNGDKAFIAATLAVFSLWAGILSVIIVCEFVGFLVWACVYFVAIWLDARPPQLLPLIERAWLYMGYDLISIWRTHY